VGAARGCACEGEWRAADRHAAISRWGSKTRLDGRCQHVQTHILSPVGFVSAGSGGSCGRGNSSPARDAGCPLRTGADTALFRWRTRLLQSVLRKASGERIKGPKFSGCLACVKMNSTAPASSALQLPCPAAIEPTVSDQLCNSAAPSALRRGIYNVFSTRSARFGDALEALVQGKGGHPPWLVQQSMFVDTFISQTSDDPTPGLVDLRA
jgi:hypothetical protein